MIDFLMDSNKKVPELKFKDSNTKKIGNPTGSKKETIKEKTSGTNSCNINIHSRPSLEYVTKGKFQSATVTPQRLTKAINSDSIKKNNTLRFDSVCLLKQSQRPFSVFRCAFHRPKPPTIDEIIQTKESEITQLKNQVESLDNEINRTEISINKIIGSTTSINKNQDITKIDQQKPGSRLEYLQNLIFQISSYSTSKWISQSNSKPSPLQYHSEFFKLAYKKPDS